MSRLNNPSASSSETTLPGGPGALPLSSAEYIERRSITRDDYVIIVVGICGAGRSTFISQLSGMNPKHLVGSSGSLRAYTTAPRYIRFRDAKTQQSIVLIDTPGYDSDQDAQLAGYDPVPWRDILPIVENKDHPIRIDAIVYVQKISDTMNAQEKLVSSCLIPDPSSKKSSRSLIPQRRLILLTTHWDMTPHKNPIHCEEDLRETDWWVGLKNQGALMRRFGHGINVNPVESPDVDIGGEAGPEVDNTTTRKARQPSAAIRSPSEQAQNILQLFFDESRWPHCTDSSGASDEDASVVGSDLPRTKKQGKSSSGAGFLTRIWRRLVCA